MPQLLSHAAMLLAVVALVDAAKQLPDSLRATRARVEASDGLPLVQRELAPAREHGMNQQLLLRAARILPRDAVFSFVGDRRARDSGAPFFFAYWLLPRRHTPDPASSDWIVSSGADPSRLGVKADVVADLGGGARVLRVRR
ncbi:MAG: hypothetical protein QOK13_1173 [Gaiellaceae bacterium]|nr:hypothetical protein [Gaiellaceae bacterium]MDX6543786.1 hypothetical protein [Gaiellaceae bacterium]